MFSFRGLRSCLAMAVLAIASTMISQAPTWAGDCEPLEVAGHFTVAFVGTTALADGSTTFTYELTWDGMGAALDHFILEVCPDASVLSTTPLGGSFGYDGSTGLFGVKWDFEDDFPVATPTLFEYTLSQSYEIENISFSAKAGAHPNRAEICGPSDECEGPEVLPITFLDCQMPDGCTGETLIQWTNNGIYTSIELSVDGAPVASLAGTATSTTHVLSPGIHEICLTPIGEDDSSSGSGSTPTGGSSDDDDHIGPPTCCSITHNPILPLPISNLSCAVNPLTCDLDVSWTGGRDYASLTVSIDGAVVQILPGAATSATLPELTGIHNVCIGGETICGDALTEVCCEVDCDLPPPPPVEMLTCDTLDPCACDHTLNWNLGALNYDFIRIFSDGIELAVLSGDAVTYTAVGLSPGEHLLCVEPERQGTTGGQTCCTVFCHPVDIPAPEMLVCTLSDPVNCTADLSWVNPTSYQSLQISVEGVTVQTLDGLAVNATVSLPGPGTYAICVIGDGICASSAPTCCPITCFEPPPPVTALTCSIADICTCTATLSWINGATDYEGIALFLDGVLHEILPGTMQSLTLTLPNPGLHTICLVPQRTGLSGPETCCDVTCDEIPVLPPMGLVCVDDAINCSLVISWTLASEYSSVQVLLDGFVAADLPGDATTFTIAGPVTGPHEISVQAVTICGVPTGAVLCTVECEVPPPPPVTTLVCELVDPCLCSATLSWILGSADYDAILVTEDGVLIATLAGDAITHDVTLADTRPHSFCVTPTRFGVSGAQTCCELQCPETEPIPPVILECVVDPISCEASVNWLNLTTFASLDVFFDGTLVATVPGDAASAMFPVTVPGTYEVCVVGTTICGAVTDPACCSLGCSSLFPATVTDVTCEITDPCTCSYDISWVSGDNYDAILIESEGVLIASLPGTDTTYSGALAGPATVDLCVTGVIAGSMSRPSCCRLTCPEVPEIAPNGLFCVITSIPTCDAAVSWENHSLYSSIEVLVDGVSMQTLPGDAVSTTLSLPGPGIHEICLVAETICAVVLPESCCPVDCPAPPAPVIDLTCVADLCTCDGTASWILGDLDYEEIVVLLDGVVITTLVGTATSVVVPDLQGEHEICVVPVRSTLQATAACCLVQCDLPSFDPPQAVTCVVLDSSACLTLVSWTNPHEYASFVVEVDGVVAAELPGTATSAQVVLTGAGITSVVCVIAETVCGEILAPQCCESLCDPLFVRGDCNNDGITNIADAVKIMRFLFQGWPVSTCLDACDHNDDGLVDVGDVIFLLSYVFQGGTAPPAPFPGCGPDPTPDDVPCEEFDSCGS